MNLVRFYEAHFIFFKRKNIMKYNLENLVSVQKVNNEIKNLSDDLNDLLNRGIIIREDISEVEQVLITPAKTAADLARHSELIKEFGKNYREQIDTIKDMNRLAIKIFDRLQKDYDETAKALNS